jgi:hypothetical protein
MLAPPALTLFADNHSTCQQLRASLPNDIGQALLELHELTKCDVSRHSCTILTFVCFADSASFALNHVFA